MSLMTRLLMLSGLLGIVTFFLPFAADISAFRAIQSGDLWRLAVPFLVPFVAVVARMVQMNRGSLSEGARRLVYLWATATILVTLSLYVPPVNAMDPSSPFEWISYVIPLVVLIAGAVVFLRSRRVAALEPTRPFLALHLAYLPNAYICLSSFLLGGNIGAYLALVTTVIYAADVVSSARSAPTQANSSATPAT